MAPEVPGYRGLLGMESLPALPWGALRNISSWDGHTHVELGPAANNRERQSREEPDERRNEKKPWEKNSNCLDRGCAAKVQALN